jgi:hypothetical protein
LHCARSFPCHAHSICKFLHCVRHSSGECIRQCLGTNCITLHSAWEFIEQSTLAHVHTHVRLQPIVIPRAIIDNVIIPVQLMLGSRTASSTWCDGADLRENTAISDSDCARTSLGLGHHLEADSVQLGRHSFAPTTASILRLIPSRR